MHSVDGWRAQEGEEKRKVDQADALRTAAETKRSYSILSGLSVLYDVISPQYILINSLHSNPLR